jgi:hypothetical protein
MTLIGKVWNEDCDKLSLLITNYRNQENYPIAKMIILKQLDKKVEQLESKKIYIREAVGNLLFNF